MKLTPPDSPNAELLRRGEKYWRGEVWSAPQVWPPVGADEEQRVGMEALRSLPGEAARARRDTRLARFGELSLRRVPARRRGGDHRAPHSAALTISGTFPEPSHALESGTDVRTEFAPSTSGPAGGARTEPPRCPRDSARLPRSRRSACRLCAPSPATLDERSSAISGAEGAGGLGRAPACGTRAIGRARSPWMLTACESLVASLPRCAVGSLLACSVAEALHRGYY